MRIWRKTPPVFKRFKREARALEKLAHPNIVPFYGLHQTLDFAFLMERYIDGPTLKDILRQRQGKPMEVEEALVYLKTVSSALGYAHAHGVVHCDVKPGNVMVDQGGSVYLTDFGVARHAESTTTTLGFAGTATYMAPEQCRGEAVSAQTDVYALGVMLYEMLTGERPFRGNEAETEGKGSTGAERVRWAHVHLDAPDPRERNPSPSEGLAQVVLKALAKEPSERYSSVRELYEAACGAVGLEAKGVPDWAGIPEGMAPAKSVMDSRTYADAQVGAGGGSAAQSLLAEKTITRELLQLIGKNPVAAIGFVGVIVLTIVVILVGGRGGESDTLDENATRAAASAMETKSASTPAPTQPPSARSTHTPTPTPTPTLVPIFGWRTEIIQKSQDVGLFSSLVIDALGNYHVGYFQDNYDMVLYANNVSGGWVFEYVTGGVERGFHLSLDIDQEGNPHIAYHIKGKNQRPRLHYMRWTGEDWDLFKAPNTEVTDTDISMVLGPDDSAHLTFQDKYDRMIKYAHFIDYAWDIHAVDLANPNCRSFPLVVDEFGNPHLAYCASGGGLNYATLQGQIWQKKTVDGDSGAGLYSSLALDSSGRPHIAYYDQNDQSLKYAYLESDWVVQTIDATGDVGQYPSIAIDSKGHIHVSYYDVMNSSLKYAHGREGEWNTYTVDNLGDVGKWNSIALDPNDLPRISYMDAQKEDLKLALGFPLISTTPATSP